MILSIVYVLFSLAAGSIASPCKLNSGNWTSSSTTGAQAAPHRDGHGSAAVNVDEKIGLQANAGLNLVSPSSLESSSPSSTMASNAGPSLAASGSSGSSSGSGSPGSSTSGGSSSSGTSDTSASLTPASGSCPQGFLNTVFNTNAGQSPGFPSATWDTLTKYGMNDWSKSRLAAPVNRLYVC